ncbi:MAG TPA: tRNA uridine-5-carboxymethylaminomethyl(34) synthesis GTPase MnmE [Spirochaetota bacterium]|nr:tRNA uridine-5-carboxymethylaminomethyl(34) synthesis GTPase MnmE [Spirochaetota bacterium]HOL57058.1 tRNA uridine-5-carboxymethylaminomethyl(34) synthesis GTPase MnmE [Spirochaetota bacterium]HPP04326.1 tRNA uridine-5-carboxymethylaminomethyl(34) synthesis GTPase MnmE [Spirochaetota bacterium]
MSEKIYYEDIICAKATPSGASAVAVIRVSGKDCWKILNTIFRSFNNKNIVFKSHRAYYGYIVDNEIVIDNVLVITFANGRSFTGEESFEIHCHGSDLISTLIINLLIKNGCRLAEPGEFSKRAFLNGKIDLTEAEAIMDLVNASTKEAAIIASRQLNGLVKQEINSIKEKISDLLASIEVFIDYPDEDLKVNIEEWLKELSEISILLTNLLKGFERGKFYRESITAVLVGKTNSGKSTIFNYLLNEDKAIVSDIHGTTRDYLDGVINVKGYGVRIYDTAGLRETEDPIELEGTKRSKQLAANSDIILYVVDVEKGLTEEDKENLLKLGIDKKIIVILNKEDKLDEESIRKKIDSIQNSLVNFKKLKICSMSALNKKGIENFNEIFLSLLIGGEKKGDMDSSLITNIRHANLIELSLKNIAKAFENISYGILDIGAFEIREALNRLGEMTGEVRREDILNRIFSKFCVGK